MFWPDVNKRKWNVLGTNFVQIVNKNETNCSHRTHPSIHFMYFWDIYTVTAVATKAVLTYHLFIFGNHQGNSKNVPKWDLLRVTKYIDIVAG